MKVGVMREAERDGRIHLMLLVTAALCAWGAAGCHGHGYKWPTRSRAGLGSLDYTRRVDLIHYLKTTMVDGLAECRRTPWGMNYFECYVGLLRTDHMYDVPSALGGFDSCLPGLRYSLVIHAFAESDYVDPACEAILDSLARWEQDRQARGELAPRTLLARARATLAYSAIIRLKFWEYVVRNPEYAWQMREHLVMDGRPGEPGYRLRWVDDFDLLRLLGPRLIAEGDCLFAEVYRAYLEDPVGGGGVSVDECTRR